MEFTKSTREKRFLLLKFLSYLDIKKLRLPLLDVSNNWGAVKGPGLRYFNFFLAQSLTFFFHNEPLQTG